MVFGGFVCELPDELEARHNLEDSWKAVIRGLALGAAEL